MHLYFVPFIHFLCCFILYNGILTCFRILEGFQLLPVPTDSHNSQGLFSTSCVIDFTRNHNKPRDLKSVLSLLEPAVKKQKTETVDQWESQFVNHVGAGEAVTVVTVIQCPKLTTKSVNIHLVLQWRTSNGTDTEDIGAKSPQRKLLGRLEADQAIDTGSISLDAAEVISGKVTVKMTPENRDGKKSLN